MIFYGINSLLITFFNFTGFAASDYYANTGGGVNYQCLPLNPDRVYGGSGSITYIYGVEYESNTGSSSFPSSTLNQNVPCTQDLQ